MKLRETINKLLTKLKSHEPKQVYCDPEYGICYCRICHKQVVPNNQGGWIHSTE